MASAGIEWTMRWSSSRFGDRDRSQEDMLRKRKFILNLFSVVLSQSPFVAVDASKILLLMLIMMMMRGPRSAFVAYGYSFRVALVADVGAWMGTDKGLRLRLRVHKWRGFKG
jgi:hypothetical protein